MSTVISNHFVASVESVSAGYMVEHASAGYMATVYIEYPNMLSSEFFVPRHYSS